MATAETPFKPQRTPQISQAMTVGRASLMLALMVAFSRLTGFGRMMVTSHFYGAGPITDAYNAAFNIPDTLSILIAGGALATGFVPVFTDLLSRGETERATRTFRAMWTLLGVAFGAITVILFALTYSPWGALLAPQKVNAATVDLYLQLLRILLVAQFFFVLGGLFSGTLNALRQFWYFALQPVAFNVGIIIGGIAGPKYFGMGIESQAWGALAGALVGSIAIQIPAIWRNGLSLRPLWDTRDEGVQKVLSSLLPIVFGLASGQIIALNLPRFFAAGLNVGELTALDNANRLMQVPLAVLASGPAIALFPTLSLLSSQNNISELRTQLASALRRTLVLCFLATALLFVIRLPLIRLLLEHGKFTPRDSLFTSQVLACYCLGLLGLSVQQFLSRGFYALRDTSTPIGIGLAAMAAFMVMAALCVQLNWGANGLAASASLAITGLSSAMWMALHKKLGGWDDGATTKVLWKSAVCSLGALGMGSAVITACSSLPIGKAADVLTIGLSCTAALVTFIGIGATLKLAELDAVTTKLQKVGRKFKR